MSIRNLLLATLCVAAHALGPQAHANDATTDTTFGAVTPNSPAGWRRAYVMAGGTVDERIVAARRTPDGGYMLAASRAGGGAGGGTGALIFLAKFRADGSYDTTFGGTAATGNAGPGRVIKDAWLTSVRDMTIDQQGRIVVVGSTPGALNQGDFGVVRFKPDGSDDTSFAGDGGTSIAFDRDLTHSRVNDVPASVTTLPDGSVLVAGTIAEHIDTPTTVVGVVKLKVDGSIDLGFGSGTGRQHFCRAQCRDVIGLSTIVYDAPRNRIVLGGDFAAGTNDTNWFIVTQNLDNMAAQTYAYPIDFGGNSGYHLAYMTALAVQADGKILASGWANIQSLAARPVVLRRQASSVAEDVGFGNVNSRGIFLGTSDNMIYNDIATDTLNRIVLVGSYGPSRKGAVQRLTMNGIPDLTFNGTSGASLFTARTTDPTVESHSTAFEHVFLDGGRPVIAGESPDSASANTDYDLVITRLRSDLIFANSLE